MTGDRGVARLEAASGVSFQHIAAARAETERRLVERRSRTASVQVDEDAAVVLMGWWGRRAVPSESDDDFMVLLVAAPAKNALPSIKEVAKALGGRRPGPEEVFGQQVLLDELRGKIGRDEDTNANLTRRMLLMLESVAICGDGVGGARCALGRAEGWGLRNAKLRLSLKALFAGGLLSVLECYRQPASDMLDYLDERMSGLRLTGSPTRSSIAAPSTPACEHSTPTTNFWRFSTTARSGGS